MESERSIRTCNSTGATTELFLCFTSRLSSSSSSSMKISSKSILSPGRPGDQPITLSTSLSRRLRTNGSLKGAQSPMFPNIAGKKRGSAFENPEPSSPKVTCIGQVRVKTKKQGRKMRTLSSRRCSSGIDAGGDVSFRQVGAADHSRQRNQRWVHLPLTICEALRGIGADFNCLFPCRSSSPSSSCFSGGERNPKSSSCGAVFERWFVTIEGGKGGGREIELVVGGEDETEETSLRRGHPLEKFNEEDEARVSICIPPKNALLLMRCRSDPVKMAALSTRLFEKDEDIYEEEEEQEHEEEKEASENGVSVHDAEKKEERGEIMKIIDDMKEDSGYSSEADAELEKLLESEEEEEEDERRKSHDFSLLFSVESNLDDEDEKTEDPLIEVAEAGEAAAAAASTEEIETSTHEMSQSDEEDEEREDQRLELSEEKEIPASEEKKTPEKESPVLPDCLLLMMCEPKLSMEVSKETWVCSTDFIRSIPDRRRPVEKPPIGAGTEEQKKRVNRNIPPLPPPPPRNVSAVLQPPRSSCTLPSMAAMIEQKLINAVGYEPFVLTRCKSEPMRTAAAKVAPESCFWKNRKLEPLRRATMGVGAAGIGF